MLALNSTMDYPDLFSLSVRGPKNSKYSYVKFPPKRQTKQPIIVAVIKLLRKRQISQRPIIIHVREWTLGTSEENWWRICNTWLWSRQAREASGSSVKLWNFSCFLRPGISFGLNNECKWSTLFILQPHSWKGSKSQGNTWKFLRQLDHSTPRTTKQVWSKNSVELLIISLS